ncbi:uncharacterized protein LOC107424002 isoform X2 [Ziziphus jujuba]|uniref:Uncharacterized protein LOC107424002 isoform X2 n=1 Tax=Ziziphus jujuba TaxID=326968 RepID=A0A6P4A2J2_ZIZJJ|nr:uncharacterized protein LOC107424002 isoform X2 [Ziziphus jujuba]
MVETIFQYLLIVIIIIIIIIINQHSDFHGLLRLLVNEALGRHCRRPLFFFFFFFFIFFSSLHKETLPTMVQTRILFFLATESQRFCGHQLCGLARCVLSGSQELDFWVDRAARNLLDSVSESNYDWISGLSLDSGEEREEDEFYSLPGFLKDDAAGASDLLPWLPISPGDLNWRASYDNDCGNKDETFGQRREEMEQDTDYEVVEDTIEIDHPRNDNPLGLGPDIQNKALCLKARLMNFESTSKTVGLANEIRQLCAGKGGDAFAVLGLLEPWLVDDETASVLILHLSSGSQEGLLTWPSQVLCSIILPKFLVLEEPVSRVLLTATIEYCKLHQRAAVYALLLPLILRRDGINNPICDLITRIVKECLHPAHTSSFCQKLLCGGKDERRPICLACHHYLLSDEMVWTESLFNLFQSILNHNACLTQDSVDRIVYQVQQSAEKFSKSLRFGNFLLCFVTKCSLQLSSHRLVLNEAVEKTNNLVTKSILSKLASF